jgi:hypothetical protein
MEIWCEGVDLIHLAEDRLKLWVVVNDAIESWIRWHVTNVLTSLATISISSRNVLDGVH